MAKQEILYVAYKDESLEEGISYATYLANLMGESLRVILLNRKGVGKKFEDLMAAVAFAETDATVASREMMLPPMDSKEHEAREFVIDRCAREGVDVNVHCGLDATIAAIINVVKFGKIDMILLSPSVTNSRNILNKLVKMSPRPVVTMAAGSSPVHS